MNFLSLKIIGHPKQLIMNRILLALLPMFALIVLSDCAGHKPEFKVYDLKCENLSDPLGTGTSTPRIGWKVKSSVNGESYSAYQILAASAKNLLSEKKADLWNSGKTESSQSILIRWQGKELLSGSVCYWKVRVWSESGKTSDWSETAFFTTGLLENSEWQGDYIGMIDSSEYCISPQLKREFEIEKPAGRYFIHVNSLGYHEVWVNGLKVSENVLAPAVSQFDKRLNADQNIPLPTWFWPYLLFAMLAGAYGSDTPIADADKSMFWRKMADMMLGRLKLRTGSRMSAAWQMAGHKPARRGKRNIVTYPSTIEES